MHTPLIAAALFLAVSAVAQGPAPGNRIYQVIDSPDTTMVDNAGNVVHTWPGTTGALSIHLDDDGSLLRGLQVVSGPGGGGTGAVERVAIDGSVLWSYAHNGPDFLSHHAVHPMPNGNVLLIVWERKTAAEAIAQGRDPALLGGPDFWPDAIVEVQPTGPTTGAIVWEWHVWDHLVQDFDPALPNFGIVRDHPELLDINFPPQVSNNGDWNHVNSLDYDPTHDWIVISSRNQSEIWIIDHGTTTAEAASHSGGRWGKGGDFLYRWGNPDAYDRGSMVGQQLFFQHDPRFIPPGLPGAGNLTVFNNGYSQTQSAVFEIDLPVQPSGQFTLPAGQSYLPMLPVWTFTSPSLFSIFVSGAQRLPNTNTLICSGLQSALLEVTRSGQVVWLHQPNTTPIFHSHYVERTLWIDDSTVSFATGGSVQVKVLSGSRHANHYYWLMGSASGTQPGFDVGSVHVPLNQDFVFFATTSAPNAGLFQDTLGILDAFGRGTATLTVPQLNLPPGAMGMQLDFAAVIFDPATNPVEASNTVSLTITP